MTRQTLKFYFLVGKIEKVLSFFFFSSLSLIQSDIEKSKESCGSRRELSCTRGARLSTLEKVEV